MFYCKNSLEFTKSCFSSIDKALVSCSNPRIIVMIHLRITEILILTFMKIATNVMISMWRNTCPNKSPTNNKFNTLFWLHLSSLLFYSILYHAILGPSTITTWIFGIRVLPLRWNELELWCPAAGILLLLVSFSYPVFGIVYALSRIHNVWQQVLLRSAKWSTPLCFCEHQQNTGEIPKFLNKQVGVCWTTFVTA